MLEGYFDHSATTPLTPHVLKEITLALEKGGGNPSSPHKQGRIARKFIDDARYGFATRIGCKPDEIIFVSSGSEANNLAVLGVLQGLKSTMPHKKKVIFSALEHPSLVKIARFIETQGYSTETLPVDSKGLLDLDFFRKKIGSDTALVSVMHINNETGVKQNLEVIYSICQEAGVLFHSDLVQSFGKTLFSFENAPFDLASTSAHKIYGPKGSGFLYKKTGVDLHPIIHGSQESYFRGGTENIPGIWGFYQAFLERADNFNTEKKHICGLRKLILSQLSEGVPDFKILSPLSEEECYPGTLCLAFPGIPAESLLVSLDMKGYAISKGSACSSGKSESSHVLKALGVAESLAKCTVRISPGLSNSLEGTEKFCQVLIKCIGKIKATQNEFSESC